MQYANGLRKVREYLEERERQFMRSDCKLDVDQEARIILRMYEAVRQKAEDSYSREAGPADPKKDLKAQQGADSSLIQPILDLEAPPPPETEQQKGGSKPPAQGNGPATGEVDGPEEGNSKRRGGN